MEIFNTPAREAQKKRPHSWGRREDRLERGVDASSTEAQTEARFSVNKQSYLCSATASLSTGSCSLSFTQPYSLSLR
jgi:hypothetical protein